MSAQVPVAIIGIGCKFPGGSDTKELYYEFLRNKGDGMTQPPADRWNHAEWSGGKDEPGKYNSAMGGFISGIDLFDPLEFGISMKEAQHLDPSLRLTLEVAHQALQDSGIDYRGSKTGVYFAQLLTSTDELDDDRYEINSYNGVGKCIAIRANRVSFTFDLRGPSLTLDTACSSSGTAMHLALSAIKLGDIDQALVLGASTMINPEHTVSFSKLGVLSPSGSSKSFDASADGYARAEGFGAVLLKRLDAATRDGDHVYSVLTGSSINANGKGKSLTMPEGDMQAETIKEAYANAGRSPSDAVYVELHATGTPVGDPIEANAAGKVFSKGRDQSKILRVGSVKANIGHAEGCSFLASMIKVSLMLHNKEIIPNIRFTKPNPKINFEKGMMKVQTELEKLTPEMAAKDGKWVTSISSYGVGGANAHVVLETFETAAQSTKQITAAPTSAVATTTKPLYLFPIGALTEPTLGRWKDTLSETYNGITDDTILRSLSKDLARQSRAYPSRAFAVASGLTPGMQFSKPSLTNGNADPKLCLVFSGQGPQHIFMGRELSASYPAFLEAVKMNDEILVKKYGQESMLERTGLFVPGKTAKLASNGVWPVADVVYSLVFVQMALVDLIKSLGIQYDFVVGHSIGEIAMGYASGHYDRETAIGIALARATAMTKAEGNGCMVALGVGVQKAKTLIKKVLSKAKATSGLWIAGINSPQAVTVAGKEELIDAMVELAANPDAKVFAAKLRVTCAFHTPLMEPQEETFKTLMKSALAKGTNPPTARIMSTVDGKWLERDLGVDYCWDNIRRPVLFGTAIDKIVKENGAEDVLFLEIAPHPVLKAYVEQCGGEPVSLIRRPNPKVPAQNTGEHYQFLEGIGNLLTAGFKRIDFAQFCTAPDGRSDFVKVNLPDYPYNRSSCWSESGSERSRRLRDRPRPVASSRFRLSVDTHPDLTGHIVFDAPLFPASGYVESILENGAMVVRDIHIHKPLVMNPHGADPGHAGCVINGNKWEFRASTTNEFDNGVIVLDSMYASGSFSRENPRFDANSPRLFDVKSKLSLSQGSITGQEFYNAIPSAYRYQDHFANYLQVVHEVADDKSWGGKGYLTRLEVPEGTPDVFGKGYVIHPGILDSITQCGLAMFINMETKLFDFSGVFLPVKIDSITRWDSRDAADLDEELKGGIWTYFTGRTWAPEGPFKSDYIITNSEGRVLFTIDGFEIARAPDDEPVAITDSTTQARLTTVWQSKHFPYEKFVLPRVESVKVEPLGASSPEGLQEHAATYLRNVFGALLTAAHEDGRQVVRVADVDPTSAIARSLDDSLLSSFNDSQLTVDYFCGGVSAEEADGKTRALKYSHARSFIVDLEEHTTSFDIILRTVDLASVPSELSGLGKLLVPSGVIVLLAYDSKSAASAESVDQQMTLSGLVEKLRTTSQSDVQVAELASGSAVVIARSSPSLPISIQESGNMAIHHFAHGNEGDLVKATEDLPAASELWIAGNDDAAGIGALGLAACLLAESPEFIVRSILFEDHSLDKSAKESLIRSLRNSPSTLEQHMKVSRTGELLVRRLVYGSSQVKATTAPGVGLMTGETKGLLSAYYPPAIGESQVEVRVDALSSSNPSSKALIAFSGSVTNSGDQANEHTVETKVVGVAIHSTTDIVISERKALVPLPAEVSACDAAALPSMMLPAWLALVDHARISESSTILIHDAASRVGFGAIQVCQKFGAKFLCSVSTSEQAKRVSLELHVDEHAIIIVVPDEDVSACAQKWLSDNGSFGFDTIFNSEGNSIFATGVEALTPVGSYIHNQHREQDLVKLPPGAATTVVINQSKLVQYYPAKIASNLSALLAAHASAPFKVPSRSISLSELSSSGLPSSLDSDGLVIIPDAVRNARVDHAGQLFNPRKSYILVGGSSELGVRITEWMVIHGARHIILTSRRGPKALTKVDSMYLHYLRLSGVQVQVVAADAVDHQDMGTVLEYATEMAPVGGVFLMTVVLRDGKFSNLTQESFDDVYKSKVEALNVLLSCVNPASLDFLLLFSTIGSVFGNAGQAAYCASQLYLDRIADILPNTVSMSFPPITDSGIFKRLVLATKGRANTSQLTKTGMTTAQVCNFIGDSLIRRIPHYVPMLSIQDVPDTFPTCEPLLYNHLLAAKFLATETQSGKEGEAAESPATLLSALVGLSPEQITENALITSFGLDSLAATRYSNQLKTHFNIKVSQIELLGSTTIGLLNEMVRKAGATAIGDDSGPTADDGLTKYGEPLAPILNERLAYDEPYTTDASPHQYRIWLAQAEFDNARKRTASRIDPQMARYGATHWDTHEAYFVTITTETPLDIDRMGDAFAEVVQRHGALRTAFFWNEEKGKLMQTIYPTVGFEAKLVDLSGEPNPAAKAYELSLAANKEPNFKLDQLPLLTATMFNLGGGEWGFNVVIHHIIIDEASLGIFFYELFALYLNGIDSLPPVQTHYSDFSDWLIRTSDRRAELRDEQLKFWAENLKDVQPLHLPLAKPSDKELSPITQIETVMDSRILDQYHQLITNAGVTPFAGFFAAYNILLFKYSSQPSFVVGTAVTQRSVAQLADVIGFFANMLPIKTTVEDDQSFGEYLASFKENLMKSLLNDDVTYEDIVAQGKTSSQGRGYFKHLFAPGGLNLDTISQLETNHIQANTILPLPNGEEQYEFLLTVHTRTGNVVLRFDNHLYSEETARQFLDAYVSLVDALGRDPYIKIRDISAVSGTEHDRLINELASSVDAPVIERCLHHLVEEQAKKTPRLTAVEFEGESLTYAELNSKANRIARSLIQQGVGSESVVALCFDRGIQQILAILAVLKAGGTFLPLDPDDPTLRKELMITDCKAKVLLTTASHSRDFEKSLASKVLIAYIDDPSYVRRLSRFDDQNFVAEGLTPSTVAYIMFTSGSTGKPKGVQIEHRSIANLVQHSHVYGFQQGVRVLSSLAYTFDPFVVDVFGTLSHGATLVTGRKELVLGNIPNAIDSLRINVLHLTPSILAVVPVESYPTLETIVVAGESLGRTLIENWSKRVTLMNMYGPTEASVDCISCHVTSPSLTGVIGRPLPNNRVYILDQQLRPAPIGVEGDLYIGGIQLARGYLHQPELTATSFIPNPFVQGERLYKTGDIALYRSDGNIEYCGRQDRQIKLRGQRIELMEIEDAIMKYSNVQRAAVVIRTLQDAPALIAFIEFKEECLDQLEDEKESLKVFISERLPRFMYPSMFATLPQLPTSRSGKVDRSALMKIDLASFAPDLSHELGLPQSDVETELLSIFAKLFKVDSDSFGVTHDLFSVGLNSLMAVQAAGTISKTFNVHIGLNNMYLRPTIRELGTLVIDAMGQESRQIMEAEDADADFLIEMLPIKKKGIHPRLFIIHDITGMATPFMRLGAFMPNEMYAIGDRHFGSPDGFASIEAMADHYITLVKSVQPEGPYIISGYSYGGSVALCVASKLVKAGDVVQQLILFDPIFIPAVERQSLKSTDWIQRSIDRIAANFPDIGDKWISKLKTEIRKNLDSMFDYEPEHYDGPATLVVPKDRSWYRSGHASDFDTGVDDRNGWDNRLSNLDMKVASGRHDTMFAPAHVKTLAGVLKEIFATLPVDQNSPAQSVPSKPKSAKGRKLNGSASKTNGSAVHSQTAIAS